MGYYSDVALTLRKEDALELIKQAKKIRRCGHICIWRTLQTKTNTLLFIGSG